MRKSTQALFHVMVEYQNGMVAIHPRHNKLLIALRTAVENGEGMLDKEAKAASG